ncbi:pilus assembly protein PilZ [Shewanella sp. NFH-SH190041]|uniref:PilZ domain-containing protein n=1 Tax=Shewanella sp. NFH-SH190041 TaxID=2950245 RepID=UPI0021C41CDF|nr:PilZ domain-containing protein [Shewanella sp. NFH-SH190041]BDM64683.1 pilus assembly protein PilZ [Shewanella sp. NFH-SH190041]
MHQLAVKFDSIAQLYRAYMPFIRGGGLFVSSMEDFELGQAVSLAFSLPGDAQMRQVQAKVVWINPLGASGGRPAGVGVKLLTDAELHRDQIEKLLASELASGNLTSTM